MRSEAASYNIDFVDALVTDIKKNAEDFEVIVQDGKSFVCKNLLIATGVKDEKLDVPGFEDLQGKSILHCPACDGYEYTGKKLAILCWNDELPSFIKSMAAYSSDLTVLTHGNKIHETTSKILKQSSIKVMPAPIINFTSNDAPCVVKFEDGSTANFEGLFYKIGHKPRLEMAAQLDCNVESDYVKVNHQQQTSVPGIYIAGDLQKTEDLVVVACAGGAIAASNIHKSLLDG